MADIFKKYASEPPAERAVVYICRKCGDKLKTKGDKSPSDELRGRLKKAARAGLSKHAVRATLVDCLDVCPKKRILVGVVPTAGPPRYLTVPSDELDEVAAQIVASLGGGDE